MPVEKGHTIHVAADELTAKTTTVNWSQDLRQRSQQYYVAEFRNRSEGDATGMIFIQHDYVDRFKAKSSGDDFSVTVDESFQYGQKNARGEGRWLAYHDRSQKPYQWRFMENTVTKYAQWVKDNFPGIPINIDVIKQFLGDYLHNF